MTTALDTTIKTLGERTVRSPLSLSTVFGDGVGNFMPDEARVRYQAEINTGMDNPDILFEKAGPRERLFFKPSECRAAIVTCGGLCPGLNNVIRSAALELHFNYGVPDILGIRYGFQGLNPDVGEEPIPLTNDFVDKIHMMGGTILGSSRGAQPVPVMVDYLEREHINILLCVGGDGTQHGTHEIAQEALRRNLKISVIGIPKTIDNDIQYVRQTFGYFTAIEKAREVLECAHNESKGAPNGIGLVKLMGRDSGFIAAGATVASQEANFTLIPEVPFKLHGPGQFLEVLKKRILARKHALIVTAEGAGQDLMPESELGRDASGNLLQKDIGIFLRDQIKAYFKEQKIPVNLKYIDPSYIIRSVAADAEDSLLCDAFARSGVHAAMAGKTDLIVGSWNGSFFHVPIPMAISSKRKVDTEGELWEAVISTTGQPRVWPA
ncbi:MAG: ATP-dependent 6-phosphofructokinase [Spartobacteria bacterium]|nr:ATP-dependent 6-phosphofructokinase [Spartobacteria bacterium]